MVSTQELCGRHMNTAPTHIEADLAGIVDKYTSQLRLARAAELAQSGRLLEAESLLSYDAGSLTCNELDLLARIHVKQGRLADALRRWREAQQLSRHGEYKTQILSLCDFAERQDCFRRRVFALFLGLWTLLLVAGVILAMFLPYK